MSYVKTNWQDGVAGNTKIDAAKLNNIENGVEANDLAITNLINDFYYKDGDTFEVSSMLNCAGLLSNSRKGVFFTIPVEKNLNLINSFTINSLKCQIRHADGGYIADNVELSTLGTLVIAKSSNNTLYLNLTLTNATSLTNNAPITVSILSCQITFNE